MESTLWNKHQLKQIAIWIALGHALNESKYQLQAPLALKEAWVAWDPMESAPKNIKLGLIFGQRPDLRQIGDGALLKPARVSNKKAWEKSKLFWHWLYRAYGKNLSFEREYQPLTATEFMAAQAQMEAQWIEDVLAQQKTIVIDPQTDVQKVLDFEKMQATQNINKPIQASTTSVQIDTLINNNSKISTILGQEDVIKDPFFSRAGLLREFKHQRIALIYKDTRCIGEEAPAQLDLLLEQRKKTLKEASAEAASILSELGKTISSMIKSEALDSMPISQLRAARLQAKTFAKEALNGLFWDTDEERRAFDYDISCREIGAYLHSLESLEETIEALDEFFLHLGMASEWFKLAGGGEQEVFFPILCELEKKLVKFLKEQGL